MYIHWDIDEDTIKNIITTLSSELDLERYRKEDALERLNEAEENARGIEREIESLRETLGMVNDENRELKSKLDGANSVVDDLINDGQQKDARIKSLTDENAALEETIRGMSDRLAMYNPVAGNKNGYDAACKASSLATDVYTDVQG